VLLGVESHEVSSSSEGGLPNASRPRGYAEEGASISINALQVTFGPLRAPAAPERRRSPGRFASGRTWQLSRELLPAAMRRENQELKTDAPSGHGLAAALDAHL
jgi:hypothetical protein